MSDHRQQDTDFLLTVPDAAIEAWLEVATLDDVLYAIELLQDYLAVCEVEDLERVDDVKDVSLASSYLAKFKGDCNA
jgi:hypothetical protein